MVTAAQIKKFCPSAKPALINAIVDNWPTAVAAGISTDLRIQHFFAQIATETGGLSKVEESLNYSVQGLLDTFSRARISEAVAKKLGRTGSRKADQVAIANSVYGGAWGKKNLGNTEEGDGWKYRGGGLLQTTGRENYRKMGFEENPEALRDPATAFKTAVREWTNRGCNKLADVDDVASVRKAINGGTNGLGDAKKYLQKAKAVFKSGMTGVSAVAALPVKAVTPAKTNAPVNNKLIEQVQDLLWDKGYPEVGESDNKFGKRTRNAILAFQADNGLPLTGAVTDDLLAQLVKAPKREITQERRTATKETVRSEPVVQAGDWLQKIGGTIIGGSLLGGVSSIDDLNNKLTSAQALYNTVSSLAPWLLGIAAGGAAIYFGSRIIKHFVQAYREGRAF